MRKATGNRRRWRRGSEEEGFRDWSRRWSRTAGILAGFLLLLPLTILRGQLDRYVEISTRTPTFATECGQTSCIDVEIRNIGATPIDLLGGASVALPFSIDPATPVTYPTTIAPNRSITIRYCYAPTVAGALDQLRLLPEFDTLAGQQSAFDTINLSGRSLSANLVINPSSIDFGNVTNGQNSCRQVTIRNNGDRPINLTQMEGFAFPFSPNNLPATTLNPGEEVMIDVCFTPILSGDYRDTLRIANGSCREPAILTVHGRGLDVTSNIGPVLQVVSPTFDTTLCGTTKCRTLTFRNVGTDPLNITSIGNVNAPFSGVIGPLPIVIQPNAERNFTLCYSPTSSPSIDSLLLDMVGDNRVSLSIAMVFDVSGSMDLAFGGTTRILAANGAGRSFLTNLINDPARGVIDEGAVYQFGAIGDFRRIAGYSSSIPTLQASIPNSINPGTPTCLYDGLVQTADQLSGQNLPGRRVMVVLADGDNSCSGSSTALADAITTAQNGGITIYTIGIGAADATALTQLATQTGGFYSNAPSPSELLQAYQRIANDLSRNQSNTIRISGRAVAPRMVLSTSSLRYDSVRTGRSLCLPLTVTNTGDAPLENVTVTLPGTNFRLPTAGIPRLLPGEGTTIQVCFEPQRIRSLTSRLDLTYSSCSPVTEQVALEGIGYDSVVVELTGEFTGAPGGEITMPLTLLNSIPDHYGVDSLQLTFRYNKTMLYPSPETAPIVVNGNLSQSMISQNGSISFGSDNSLLTVTLAGGRIVNVAGPSELARIAFLILHGNALSTPVELVGMKLADGNPKVGLRGAARFTAEGLCFQEDRLVDASARFPAAKVVAWGEEQTSLQVELPREGVVEITLYDLLGNRIALIDRDYHPAGSFQLDIDWSGIPHGSYLIHLLSSNGIDQDLGDVLHIVH